MEIRNNITFGAKFIKPVEVLKLTGDRKTYAPANLSLIEILPDNPQDINTLTKLAHYWGDDSFVNNIEFDAKYISRHGNSNNAKFYALTMQKQKFDELCYQDITIAAEVSEKETGNIKLNYIQKDPEFIYSYRPPLFKKVGSALLDCIKEFSKGKTITLRSTPSAVWFYKDNGFEECGTRIFCWKG